MDRLARDPADRRLSRLAPSAAPADLPPEIDWAMRFIMERHAEPLSLAGVARHCGLAPQAFSRLFERQTGHTFATMSSWRRSARRVVTEARPDPFARDGGSRSSRRRRRLDRPGPAEKVRWRAGGA